MSANLNLLGIDQELLDTMRAEMSHKRTRIDPEIKLPPKSTRRRDDYDWPAIIAERKTLQEKDIPLSSGLRNNRYPLQNMQVGEHFFVPCSYSAVEKTQNSLSSCIRWARKRSGRTFEQKRYPGGIRVKRLS